MPSNPARHPAQPARARPYPSNRRYFTAFARCRQPLYASPRGIAKEVADRGITVNAVAPGFISDTPFHETFTPREPQRASIQQTPLKRGSTPADVVGAVLYLCSDLAAFMTGEVIEINGGLWFA